MNNPIYGEPLITLGIAARRFPAHKGTGTISPKSLARWILRGCLSATEKRVYLEAVRAGNRWLTSEAALSRFLEALTDQAQGDRDKKVTRSPAVRSRASEMAAAELKKLGA